MAELITGVQKCVNDALTDAYVLEVLDRHYPDHNWWVDTRGAQGVLIVKQVFLSGTRGFLIKLWEVHSWSDLAHKVKMAGGKLLELYGVPRKRADQEFMAALPTDFAGRHIPLDDSPLVKLEG